MKFPKLLKEMTEEEGELIEDKTKELATDESLDVFLKSIKLSKSEEYLESWRKDYLERLNQLINWVLREPKDFSDVVAGLWRFEEFYGQMILLVAKSETMKQFLGKVGSSGQEVG